MDDMDDLYAKFLPQFLALSRTRVAAALAAATAIQRDDAAAKKIVNDLHTLAGEAGLLGLKDVVPLARICEQKAKQLHLSHAGADAEALVGALRELGQIIESKRSG